MDSRLINHQPHILEVAKWDVFYRTKLIKTWRRSKLNFILIINNIVSWDRWKYRWTICL